MWSGRGFIFVFFSLFISSCVLKICLPVLVSCSYIMYILCCCIFTYFARDKNKHTPFRKILCFIKHYWYTSYDIIVTPLCSHVYYMRYLTIVLYQFYKCLNSSHDITEILFDVALNTTQSIYLLSGL